MLARAVASGSRSRGVPVEGDGADVGSERLAARGEDGPEENVQGLSVGAGPVREQAGCLVEKRQSEVVKLTGDEGHAGEVAGREKRQDLQHNLARQLIEGGHGWWCRWPRRSWGVKAVKCD